MHARICRILPWLVSAALLLWLSGCAAPSPPTRFYSLEGRVPTPAMPQSVLPGESLPLIGIGPVELASYLDRPQLVERSTPHRLQLHEFDRWAGTLQENAVQLLRDAIQRELTGAQVIGYPWHSSVRPDYEVSVTINRFERQGGEVRLEARWTLVKQPQGRLLRLGRQPFASALDGSGMEATVAAASLALERLGQALAGELGPLLVSERK